jgi:hypothetical protein
MYSYQNLKKHQWMFYIKVTIANEPLFFLFLTIYLLAFDVLP